MAADFHAKTFYATELCQWAVESWAIGFGVKQQPAPTNAPAAGASARPKPGPPQATLPLKTAEVSFDYLQSDRDAYDRYCESRSTEPDRQRRVLHLIAAGIGVLVAVLVPSHWWSRALAFGVTWLVLFWAVIAILRACEWLARRLSGKRPDKATVLDRYTIRISSDGISETTPLGSEHRAWRVMDWLQVEPEHLFIFGLTNFYVIPLRAFKNDVNKGLDFVALAKIYFDASRQGQGAEPMTTRSLKNTKTPKQAGSKQSRTARKK